MVTSNYAYQVRIINVYIYIHRKKQNTFIGIGSTTRDIMYAILNKCFTNIIQTMLNNSIFEHKTGSRTIFKS